MPIYTRSNIRLLHIHVPKTGGTSITEQFFEEGWTVTCHNMLEATKSIDYPEFSQHLHYERLTKSKVFDSLATTIDGMATMPGFHLSIGFAGSNRWDQLLHLIILTFYHSFILHYTTYFLVIINMLCEVKIEGCTFLWRKGHPLGGNYHTGA